METVLIILAAVLLLGGLYTAWKTRQIDDRHGPEGEFALVDSVRLHYFHYALPHHDGKRPALVFVHGASGNALDPLIAFKDRFEGRHELLFVDRPGLGHSRREPERHANPVEQARSIGALLDKLGIDDCVVVGHSLGASVSAALALERPDVVSGTVFVAPATHPWPGGINWYYRLAAMPLFGPLFCRTITLPVAERLAPASISGVFSPHPAIENYAAEIKLPLLFRPHSFRANAMDVAGLKGFLKHQSRRYGDMKQPGVVITGDQDTVVWPSIHSEGLIRDMPDAELILLEGAGHMPHHTHGDEIACEIEKLLAKLADRQTASLAPTSEVELKSSG
ncbi:alpha/beta fold hydrolase [Roseibium sp.]|uniref:alpha/beta fold hydrolase n=1 Tax=Roseibium sp. TaxID=1936156 RepID=UPI003A983BDB